MAYATSKMILFAGLASLALEAQAGAPGMGGAAQPVAQKTSRPCSPDSLSQAEQQRLMNGYRQRLRTSGKAAAQAWARVESDRAYRQLVAEGVCPGPSPQNRQTAQATRRAAPKRLLNKQGKPCKRIEVENQVFPNFGGAPMTMGLVSVCKD
ncbi:hypothetical protein OK349_18685 [Sphingomonas sp. BT-65]|uniref:hypothetical protein n=1 Tax=Sphingomonas sp. BT-65 TaxID=2989821 RepID=UPI0022367979|nr:hypothetical protein [Sphingomonas sp. BT-65]MCW4463738.1 hypothetical protein [Sphingomonas sp. BT-65]